MMTPMNFINIVKEQLKIYRTFMSTNDQKKYGMSITLETKFVLTNDSLITTYAFLHRNVIVSYHVLI